MAILINVPNLVYVLLAYYQPQSLWLIGIGVTIEKLGYGFGFTGYMLYMLYLAQGKHQTSFYAICTGFMTLGLMLPASPAGSGRAATDPPALSRQRPGAMLSALAGGEWGKARAVAETVQRVRPDVLLVNEFDHDPSGRALELFARKYLEHGWNGAAGVEYPYTYTAPVNTGVASGADLNGDGRVVTGPGSDAYAGDAFGFGRFPGQYGMAVLSRYPLDAARARTFRLLPRAAMPGALVPVDPDSGEPFLSPQAWATARLSSKSHWDLPVDAGWDRPVHLLASHPTPPAFDGRERRNVLRNHDEIRFWADYLTPGADGYVRDDAGAAGGLAPDVPFVLAGDLNADPRVHGILVQLPLPVQIDSDVRRNGLVNTDYRIMVYDVRSGEKRCDGATALTRRRPHLLSAAGSRLRRGTNPRAP
jgi:hypothetical protein